MKNNQLDNFESLIKSSLDKQRAVYDSSDWDKLNKKLDQVNKPFYSSPWFIAASVAAVLGTVYLLSTFNTLTEPTPLVITPQEYEIPEIGEKEKEDALAIPLTEEEHNEIKEVFINAEKIEEAGKKKLEEANKKVAEADQALKNATKNVEESQKNVTLTKQKLQQDDDLHAKN